MNSAMALIKTDQLEKTFFQVEKIEDATSRFGYAVINKNNGKRISQVSKEYVLVPNRDAVMPFVERYGLKRLISFQRFGNSFSYKFNLGDEIDMGEGDMLKRMGYVTNSYDKTVRFRWQDGFFRKVCLNGLFVFAQGASVSEVHYGNFNAHEAIREALFQSSLPINVEVWKSLKKVAIDRERKNLIIDNFKPMIVNEKPGSIQRHPSETVNRSIQYYAKHNASRTSHDLDNQPNGWGLLNNINWGISRACGEKNLSRIISLNQKAEDYLTSAILN